jgi:hypothetical protein
VRETNTYPNILLKDDSDDDLNDEDIPGFGGAGTPLLATPDKGKGRAPQNLASPGLPPPVVSGSINASANVPRGSTRQSFGGVQVESRYASRLHTTPFPPLSRNASSLVMVE